VRYRSRTDIISQILEAATGGATKTKIMYRAFLSYAQLKEYLNVLTINGLLDYNSSEQVFRTTEKGDKFLKLYSQIGEIAPPALDESIPARRK
jgi:predicted transcriptional regulator